MAQQENRLSRETSPYLRQHRFDPVDWYPWGAEALERARELDRPLFLSIGYSACHWCHVMAHESFADEATAAEMNRTVVAVKIDREERPDVDSVYMEAVLAANGHGGWPMSVFATPDGRPFFTGTYFPDTPRQNMPSFRQVLGAVSDVWTNRRDDVEAQANALSTALGQRMAPPAPLISVVSGEHALSRDIVSSAIRQACDRLTSISDREHGGFGDAPKFPQPLLLDLLLRAEVAGIAAEQQPPPLDVVLTALEAMASGGIYDQIGGGFSRYSVDRIWLVPHFEKMLYDQVLLARVYLHAWQITGDERLRQILDETVGYMLTRLAHPAGGLCSAEDADSEGEEGRFYLWSATEFAGTVGPELAAPAAAWYGVTDGGNFEGRNILTLAERGVFERPAEIEKARTLLEAGRSRRVRPGLDDKVLTEWNAMAVSVLAECAGATEDPRYGAAAESIFSVLRRARDANEKKTPRLVRSDGGRPIAGFAGDVAWLLDAAVRLFELTGRTSYLEVAREAASEFVSQFVDAASGGVFTTRADGEELVVRPVELTDGVIPSASSVGAVALLRLAGITGEQEFAKVAALVVAARAEDIANAPAALPELLWAADLVTGGLVEIAASGKGSELLPLVRRRFLPSAIYAWRSDFPAEPEVHISLLDDRVEDAVYVCHGGVCRLPAHDAVELQAELEQALRAHAAGAPR